MKTKLLNILFLVFVMLNGVEACYSQTQLYTVIVGESAILSVNGANGTIQWQQSEDSLVWTDIPGATTSPYTIVTSISGTGKRFFVAKITNTSICNNSNWYSSVIRHKIIANVTQVSIGDLLNGGIVYYTDGTGNGLIVPQTDQSGFMQWGCSGASIPGAASLTDGAANTTAIVAACATRPIAASICDTLTLNNYNDWFLPAKNQLNQLYQQNAIIGSLAAYPSYWSSSEYDAGNSWRQFLDNGWQYSFMKYDDTSNVRCIRSFSPINNVSYSTAVITSQPVAVNITTQPIAQNKCLGSSVTFTVATTGTATISYQWKKAGANITNAINSSYTISNLTLADEGIYTCEVTNLCRTITSSSAELKVIDLNVNAGTDITFCNDTATHLIAVATTNHSELGILNYSWSPTTNLGSASTAITTAQPINNTNYTILITDQVGCTKTDVIFVTSKTPVSITTQPLSYNKCLSSNVTFTLNVSGTSPISYVWKKNGTLITSAMSNTYSINSLGLSDEGIFTCEPTNYCSTLISNPAELKVIDINANAGLDERLCNGQNIQLQATSNTNHITESGSLNYSWSPTNGLNDPGISNPIANPLINSIYFVTVTDQLGCSESDNINIVVQNVNQDLELCIVTVDTNTWRNKIMWEKTLNEGTAGYSIYKEVSTGIYSGIGFVPFSDPAFYIDYLSSPESFSNRYKITEVDTCGSESAKSFYHKTVNLTIAAFGSTMGLNWNDYVDESTLFIPANYFIYRGLTPTSMQLLDSVPGGTNSYNDNNVFNVYYYIIGVKKTGGCNSNKSDFVSFSNKKDNSLLLGINSQTYGTITVSPNPFTESTTITIPNVQLTNNNAQIIISDVTGKIVRTYSNLFTRHSELVSESPQNPQQIATNPLGSRNDAQFVIERGNLKPGVYFVELKGDRVYRGKLVVE